MSALHRSTVGNPSNQFIRFLVVAVIGLGIDLGVAWILAVVVEVPVLLAAVVGFGVALLFNYTLNEAWTFKVGSANWSVARLQRYFAVLLGVLGLRLAIIAMLLEVPALASSVLLIMVLATGVSFLANFALCRVFVFKRAVSQSGGSRDRDD